MTTPNEKDLEAARAHEIETRRVIAKLARNGFAFFDYEGCIALRDYLGLSNLLLQLAWNLEHDELITILGWLDDVQPDGEGVDCCDQPDGSGPCTIVWFREIPWSEAVISMIIRAEEEMLAELRAGPLPEDELDAHLHRDACDELAVRIAKKRVPN